MSTHPSSEVEIGSRWHVWGHHWEVVEYTTRDGEPAVRVRCLSGAKPKKVWGAFVVRLLLKHGKPSEAARYAAAE